MAQTRPGKIPGDPEKPRSGGIAWVWIILALLLLGLLVWWMWPKPEIVQEDLALAPTETVMTETAEPEPASAAAEATIAAILEQPATWIGRELSGTFRVAEVPTDRGFWIEQDGQRLFVILIDQPAEEPMDINPGQTVQLRGTVRDPASTADIAGEDLTEATRSTLGEQQVFVVADEDQIEIVEAQESGQ